MASAPSVGLWVGQTAARGTGCKVRHKEPLLVAGLIKVSNFIKLGHHQGLPGISQTGGIFF